MIPALHQVQAPSDDQWSAGRGMVRAVPWGLAVAALALLLTWPLAGWFPWAVRDALLRAFLGFLIAWAAGRSMSSTILMARTGRWQ